MWKLTMTINRKHKRQIVLFMAIPLVLAAWWWTGGLDRAKASTSSGRDKAEAFVAAYAKHVGAHDAIHQTLDESNDIPPVFHEPSHPGKCSRNQNPAVDYFYSAAEHRSRGALWPRFAPARITELLSADAFAQWSPTKPVLRCSEALGPTKKPIPQSKSGH